MIYNHNFIIDQKYSFFQSSKYCPLKICEQASNNIINLTECLDDLQTFEVTNNIQISEINRF